MSNGNGDGLGWARTARRRIGALRTVVRIGLRLYPRAFARDAERIDRILGAFARTVVPGLPTDDPVVTKPFYDDELSPLSGFRRFLAWDLSARAARRFDGRLFETLSEAERIAVIQEALEADPKSARLFGGAIFLIQIASYAGIYRDDEGCPLIFYEGRFRERSAAEIGYADAESYLAPAKTADGNPA